MMFFTSMVQSTWEVVLIAPAGGLLNGGLAGMLYSYIWTFIFFIFIVMSLAEMASMCPTSGGQYHWCEALSLDVDNFLTCQGYPNLHHESIKSSSATSPDGWPRCHGKPGLLVEVFSLGPSFRDVSRYTSHHTFRRDGRGPSSSLPLLPSKESSILDLSTSSPGFRPS